MSDPKMMTPAEWIAHEPDGDRTMPGLHPDSPYAEIATLRAALNAANAKIEAMDHEDELSGRNGDDPMKPGLDKNECPLCGRHLAALPSDGLAGRLLARADSYDQSGPSAKHTADLLREAAAALLAREDWVLVPRVPTDAMMQRAGDIIEREYGESDWEEAKDMAEGLNPRPIWDAMLAAAPTAAPKED